ncbi:sensor histidine kinase [Aeromicrobium sp. CF3.5]|uniref:sensor histidine kinase n=1 Tax=Aeromicrobium sp. CF3.5 TaxID=3373078 RepID=UPI003EE6724D
MLDLDRPWKRPVPTSAQLRHDLWTALAAIVVAVASVELWHSANGASLGWMGVEAYLWFALAGALLAGRRRFPLTALLLVSAVFITIGERLTEFGVIFSIQIILFVALYSAWAWSRHPRRLQVTSAIVLVAMFGWLIWQFLRAAPPALPQVGLVPAPVAIVIYSLLINIVYFFGAMAWGQGAWRSARQRAEIDERAERERALQVGERERAVQDERVRIARDLHDVVAHHVSSIGVQAAGAGRVLDTRPDDARRALETIERSSRQAVSQMHELVGLLRSADETTGPGPDDREPQPGLGALHALATQGRGRPIITFTQVGAPFDVPSTVEASLYRVAQEAVTNVRRHARAQHAGVTLRYIGGCDERPATVEIEIVDDGAAMPEASDGSGGYGLAGIRERTSMHGGQCDIGPRPQGGFRVRVQVPVTS